MSRISLVLLLPYLMQIITFTMANQDRTTPLSTSSDQQQSPDLLKDMNFFTSEICSRLDSRTCLRLYATNSTVKSAIADVLIQTLQRELLSSSRLSPDVILPQLRTWLRLTNRVVTGPYDQLCRLYDRIQASPKLRLSEYRWIWNALLRGSEKLHLIHSANRNDCYISAGLIEKLRAYGVHIPEDLIGTTHQKHIFVKYMIRFIRLELLYDYDFLVLLLEEKIRLSLTDVFFYVIVPNEALCQVLPLYQSFWPAMGSVLRYNWTFLEELAQGKPENRAVFWQIPVVIEHYQDRIPELIRELGQPGFELSRLLAIFNSQYPYCKGI